MVEHFHYHYSAKKNQYKGNKNLLRTVENFSHRQKTAAETRRDGAYL